MAGCGGGSSESTGSAAASGELSKSEWLAQADEICKAERQDVAPLNKELDRLNESGLSIPKEIAEFAAILRKALPRSDQALRELRELEPPSGESDAIDALLEKVEETQELIEETAGEMEAGNMAKPNASPSKRTWPNGAPNGWHSAMTSRSVEPRSRPRPCAGSPRRSTGIGRLQRRRRALDFLGLVSVWSGASACSP